MNKTINVELLKERTKNTKKTSTGKLDDNFSRLISALNKCSFYDCKGIEDTDQFVEFINQTDKGKSVVSLAKGARR